jgi:2-polyprenyl-3-methyl-5-hydroxy-6-metoxy-1,4-benzoquinol methylase
MIITETNKTKIKSLMEVVRSQTDNVESITVQMNENFNVEPFVPYLLNDPNWAFAVDPLLIADPNSEEDKLARAHGILSVVITEAITGNFLDFGCGEGHVVAEVAKNAKKSVGYDILDQGWERFTPASNRILTTSWKDVEKNGPYDKILIYDVLDHLKDEKEVIEELNKVASVLSSNGKVFVRCHPWCSRHGTHLYHSINRAYLHLCLDEPTLDRLGYKYLHTIKVIHPLQTYQRWFDLGGLSQVKVNITSEKVEQFFWQTAIASLIKRNWRVSHEEDLSSGTKYPDWQMGQQFVDILLQKKVTS